MKKIERIAGNVASDTIVDRKSFKEWVEEEFYVL